MTPHKWAVYVLAHNTWKCERCGALAAISRHDRLSLKYSDPKSYTDISEQDCDEVLISGIMRT